MILKAKPKKHNLKLPIRVKRNKSTLSSGSISKGKSTSRWIVSMQKYKMHPIRIKIQPMSECKSTPISTTHCMSSLPMHSLRSLDTQTQIATPFLTNHQITNLTRESQHLYLGRLSRKKVTKLRTASAAP